MNGGFGSISQSGDLAGITDLYAVQDLPVFQNRIYQTQAEALACPRGNVTLAQNLHTGLIYNRTFQPELMTYDSQYQNEQAVSAAFRTHLDEIASLVNKHFLGMTLLEVGCGKGHFLYRLRDEGFVAKGIDPTYEGDDPSIVKAYFTPNIGLRADALVLRHVLEHVQDPYDFLVNLRESNAGHGKIYIEVPALEWVLKNQAWFDIYYEHVNYFRLQDFGRLFSRIEFADYSFGGQYLSVVADLSSLRPPAIESDGIIEFPANFDAPLERHAQRMRNRGARKSIVWGGSSKGVIFSLRMRRAGAEVATIVDINPAKQGRFVPAVGLLVESPGEALASCPADTDIYVMNRNYLDEIRHATDSRFNYFTVDHDSV